MIFFLRPVAPIVTLHRTRGRRQRYIILLLSLRMEVRGAQNVH